MRQLLPATPWRHHLYTCSALPCTREGGALQKWLLMDHSMACQGLGGGDLVSVRQEHASLVFTDVAREQRTQLLGMLSVHNLSIVGKCARHS